MGQKREFRGAVVQIACCLAALLALVAGRGRGGPGTAQDSMMAQGGLAPTPRPPNIQQITLTPDIFTSDLAPDPGGFVWFIGYSGSPSDIRVGRFTSLGAVTSVPFPSSGANVTTPRSITKGAEGNLWIPYYIETPSHSSVESGVFRVTPSYTFSKFAFANPLDCAVICRSTLGSDGNVWVAQFAPGAVAKVTTSGAITEYALPFTPFTHNPSDITPGPDGNLWSVYPNGVDRITPAGAVTTFANPQASALLNRITQGPDANLYATDSGTNAIWRLTTSGAWTQYLIPTANSGPFPIAGLSDGNVWFGEFNSDNIGQLSLSSGMIAEFSNPGYSPVQLVDSQTAAPNAYLIANNTNSDPRLFGLSFVVGPTPTPCVPPIFFQVFGDRACRVGDSCLIEFEPSLGIYTYSISNTVPGMSLEGAEVTGEPTTPGDYTFTVTATDERGCKGSITVSVHIDVARDASQLLLEGILNLGGR